MSYKLEYTGKEIGERLESCELIKSIETIFDLIYPVGSIYMSVNAASPMALFGGEWEQIQDTFLLAAGSNYAAGAVGGEAEHNLTIEEMPEHTHDRGSMDITGTIYCYSSYNKDNDNYWTDGVCSGAFYKDPDNYKESGSNNNQSDSATADACRLVSFKASNSWTGETSNIGGSAAHNNMPPYLAVYMWKRIA